MPHGSKLPSRKDISALAHPILLKKYGTCGINLYGQKIKICNFIYP